VGARPRRPGELTRDGPASDARAAAGLRRRAAAELGALAALTALYLGLWPRRPAGLDLAMGLLGLGLVGLLGRYDRGRFWPAPATPARTRRGRALRDATALTLLVLGLFAGWAAWDAFAVRREWADVAARLWRPRALGTLGVYLPWALLQQTLFQRYLHGRWRALVPTAPGLAAALTGLAYGAVHLPQWELALLTTAGGVAWSALYARDRLLLPLAGSHALLGTAFYAWVRP
jgi:hypothetical protein